MRAVAWRQLGESAEDYILARMLDGMSIASRMALEVPQFEEAVVAMLPCDIDDAAAHNFADGFPPPQNGGTHDEGRPRVGSLQAPLADWLRRYLTGSNGRYLLLENVSSRIGDPELLRRRAPIATLESEIYSVVEHHNAFPWVITAALDESSSYPEAIGMLLSDCRTEQVFASESRLRTDLADELRPHLMAVMVEAYDGEGMVVWTRNKTVSPFD